MALSIMQPWASLIVGWKDKRGVWWPGPKGIENRGWKLPEKMIGQRIAIHAGKREDDSVGASIHGAEHIYNAGIHEPTVHNRDYPGVDKLPMGAIVGVARVVGCVHSRTQLRVLNRGGVRFSTPGDEDWYTGAFGFLLEEREAITPIEKVRGMLGFFDVSDEHEREIGRRLAARRAA